MSTAVLAEPAVKGQKTADRGKLVAAGEAPGDQHPLAAVFIIGALASLGAVALIGSMVIWLALRNSGVLAP